MTTYSAYEDIGFGTDIESEDTPEQALERASERFSKAWQLIDEMLTAHPELGVHIGGRYDDDLVVYDDRGHRVAGG